MDNETRRATNSATLEKIRERLRYGDWAGLGELWAEDGVMELPYASRGTAGRIEGRQAIVENQLSAQAVFSRFETPIFTAFPTTDADLFFAEYASDAEIKATGRPYRNCYVGVFRFRDGKLVHWKEYFDPNVIREAFRPV